MADDDLLHDAKSRFYVDYGRLIAATLAALPKHLRADAMMRINEISAYGSGYSKYIAEFEEEGNK